MLPNLVNASHDFFCAKNIMTSSEMTICSTQSFNVTQMLIDGISLDVGELFGDNDKGNEWF